MTKFEKWFKAQFGTLPMAPIPRENLFKKREALRSELKEVESKIFEDDIICTAWKAALYAKNASETEFKF